VTAEPVLHLEPARGNARAVALVLHGGRAKGTTRVRAHQLAVLRMRPFSAALHAAGSRAGLAVATLRYAVRGWNGKSQSPVADVQWALDRLATRYPDVPVALVGHSMGGRAAIYAAGASGVRALVGLAPWIEARDPWQQLAGRHLLVVHGDRDRITSPPASAAYARHAADLAASAAYVSVHGERHAMLHRPRLWHEICTGWVLARMCEVPPTRAVGRQTARLLERILAGEPAITV
jgi:alpha-beta hydrolase superfamily lysophospholipase